MVFCLFCSPSLDPLWSSRSLVFRILSPNPNFSSLLHWKNFLNKNLIMFCLFSRKKLKLTLWFKVVGYLNLPIARMVHETYVWQIYCLKQFVTKNVENVVSTSWLLMDEMVTRFQYYIRCKLYHMAMLVFDFWFWLIVESLHDITIVGMLTFDVFG